MFFVCVFSCVYTAGGMEWENKKVKTGRVMLMQFGSRHPSMKPVCLLWDIVWIGLLSAGCCGDKEYKALGWNRALESMW